MSECYILLETRTRDLMKSVARKDQTYDKFIVELIKLKIQSEPSQDTSRFFENKKENNPGPEIPQSKARINLMKVVAEGEPLNGTT